MTAHDTYTTETAHMNARIARLEEDRALRTRQLLAVEQEVVDLRAELDKTRRANRFLEQALDLLRLQAADKQGGVHESLGDTETIPLSEQPAAPAGVPSERKDA